MKADQGVYLSKPLIPIARKSGEISLCALIPLFIALVVI